jgi:RNA polymerase sigma-70 factor (ECF subfamily)
VDATHDCFARAFERWAQYDSHRPLRAWLHGIVSHAALDDLRRRRIRRLAAPAVLELRSLSGDAARTSADPAVEVLVRQRVDEAMAGLKPDARAALVLRHYYGYDYAEIAGFLRTSPGNVGSILSRAHAAIRVRLTEDQAIPADPTADPTITKRAAQ